MKFTTNRILENIRQGLTQVAFAEKIGLHSKQHYNRIKKEYYELTFSKLEEYCNKLGKEVSITLKDKKK